MATSYAPEGRGPRFAVVGVRDGRRVALFTAAARAAGLAAPRVLDWSRVLRAGAVFAPGETVRIDSPGEDVAAERALRGVDDPTRVEGTARWYARFTSATAEVADAARAAGARLLDDPGELAVLFDKRRCHGVLRAAGVPVPPSPTSLAPATPAQAQSPPVGGAGAVEPAGPCAPVRGWDDVRASLAGPGGLRRAFVKLAHGSSASGVLAVEWAGPGRVSARTSVERSPDGRLFNSLRVRRYATEVEVAALVDALAPDGLHVERWLPKASQRGRAADLRIVVVGGRATHAVVRTSRSPMTNLHLGGARGGLAAARAATEAAGVAWGEVLGLAERAAACFPGTLCVGVDVLPGTGWRRFAVGEVNAFGDLLPRLTGLPGSGAEGLDTYGAQIAAVMTKEHHHATR
ncbi:STM4014 family protein [Streptomyces buecherae]|uniref:STM4014 family protein n=1 Tax=Streptomyces buecherae TaxID=2763006 RepID=A0A7H8NI63_9ACTN|nr:STM4014 family protein [Streptomyces buecherae]QKW54233.1 STM4014 family protein [Streptomyces buecherae]